MIYTTLNGTPVMDFLVAMRAISCDCLDPIWEIDEVLWVIITPIILFLSSTAGWVAEAARVQSHLVLKESVATTRRLWWTLEAARNQKTPRVSTFLEMKARRLTREGCASMCDQQRRRMACMRGPKARPCVWTPTVDPYMMFLV